MKKKDGLHFEVPTLYDINGSAAFFNKSDYGLSIYRDFQTKQIDIYFQKVKFKHLGEAGLSQSFGYNINNGRLDKWNYEGNVLWDNTNWLTKEAEQKQIEYEMSKNEQFESNDELQQDYSPNLNEGKITEF
jgi:twinkle protein